ncbi:MAG: methyltransferase [Desulfobacterales bacterium]
MKLLLFFILSLPLVVLSRRTLFNLKKHGFYRLVVWECILWISIRNHRHLIVETFDLQQFIASVLMIASLAFVLSAVFMLRRKGRANRQRDDETLFVFEKTTVVIESGIFRYVRHPMYSSLLLLAWGLMLRNIETPSLMVAIVATGAGIVAALVEEKENIAYFGERYKRYMLKTKRFVPYFI